MSETREMPIIMLTAKGFELSVEDIRQEYGVVELLSKPFSPRELLQLVDDTLEQNTNIAEASTPVVVCVYTSILMELLL